MNGKATPEQISTFWSMAADRRWDDSTQLLNGRKPRTYYLAYIKQAYKCIKAGTASKQQLSLVINDLYCFKGYEVERRVRAAK